MIRVRLGLRFELGLGLSFMFSLLLPSLTALSSCVTVMSHVEYE